jgi:hypothetical protein
MHACQEGRPVIENVPSFTSLRVSDALKDLVLEIARTFSLALLWRQVMLAGTGNELIADEDRSPGRMVNFTALMPKYFASA